MILPFSTQLNGKPTYFVEKILRCFLNEYSGKVEGIGDFIYESGEVLSYQYADDILNEIEHKVKPKLHTIREDKNDRWKPAVMIDFFINARQKNMFRFAPRIPVVSTQKVRIVVDKHYFMNDYQIFIDERELNLDEKVQFSHNDGFSNLFAFFLYFNKDYTGKLIHWTDKRY